MSKSFTPSVNIVRDSERSLDYILTSNAKRVYEIISRNYQSGNRAFTILGTYGTGKSAFLWAFEKHLTANAKIFEASFNGSDTYRFTKIVASYQSCRESLSLAFGLSADASVQDVLTYLNTHKTGGCRVIVIDEFGKFLEHAGKHDPEREMYFIQQLAEYAAHPENKLLLITTLHQSFDAYALALDQRQRNEWEKVKGRLTEVTFNEPVEQLLHIASQRIEQREKQSPQLKKSIKDLATACETHAISSLRLSDKQHIAKELFPLEIASASVLAQSLQHYGQNERSLFTFLDSDAHDGLAYFRRTYQANTFYALDRVYDYLIFNFYSVLSSYYNPDYFRWTIIKDSLDRAEGHLPAEQIIAAAKLIKAIGLLNIFASQAATVNHDFLIAYGRTALGIEEPDQVIEVLEQHKIIRYVRFKDSFVLFEGTDFDIEKALREAATKVDPVQNVVPRLKKVFNLPPLSAKSYYYKTGTPRYFNFEFSTKALDQFEDKKYDGCINLIFQDPMPEEIPNANDNAILYGWYPRTEELRQIIHEMDTAQYVFDQIVDDSVAKREITNLKSHLAQKLNAAIFDAVYHHPGEIEWYFLGTRVAEITNTTQFNQFLSRICEEYAYKNTPIFRSELVNRTKVPSTISAARRRLIESMIHHWQEADFGFAPNKFPPEKAIYLSLLKGNLHDQLPDGSYGFCEPKNASFHALWKSGEAFLDSTREQARPLSDLIDIWTQKPFRLKQGFIDFWLPIYLFIKRSEFALYFEGNFMPELSPDNFDIIFKSPHKVTIKCFELAGERLSVFNKFREMLQLSEQSSLTQDGFVETIRPYLTFYRELSEYACNTRELNGRTVAFREAIRKAKDPEKTFFEDFPTALGYTIKELSESTDRLQAFSEDIKSAVHELREVYPRLLSELESTLLYQMGIPGDQPFQNYKQTIAQRYESLKVNLLSARQKTFFLRLSSPIDDRNAWLASIGQFLFGKNLDTIRDQDREVLPEKLGYAIRALDNLLDMMKLVDTGDNQDVLHIQVTSLREGMKENVLKVPLVDLDSIKKLKADLSKKLPKKDPALALAALTQMIQELLTDD